jgi:ribosome-associated protein
VTASDRAIELVLAAAAAQQRRSRPMSWRLTSASSWSSLTPSFSASAPNERQVAAIVDAVQERLTTLGAKPVRREGERDGRWVLLDYAEIVVHVQHDEERIFYALERLWKDCPLIPLPEGSRGRPREHLEA